MALIIEDGTGVENANSYITVAEARAFAANRGYTMPTDDADVEVLIYRAMDYFESLRGEFKGYRTETDQSLQWPRANVYIDNVYVDSATIPDDVKNAVCQLALDSNTQDIDPNGSTRETILEKIDVIEVEYSAGYGGTNMPVLNKAKRFILPLIKTGSLGFDIIRI